MHPERRGELGKGPGREEMHGEVMVVKQGGEKVNTMALHIER